MQIYIWVYMCMFVIIHTTVHMIYMHTEESTQKQVHTYIDQSTKRNILIDKNANTHKRPKREEWRGVQTVWRFFIWLCMTLVRRSIRSKENWLIFVLVDADTACAR